MPLSLLTFTTLAQYGKVFIIVIIILLNELITEISLPDT